MENLDLCKECGGYCCKAISGMYLPEQVPDWRDRLGADGDLEIAFNVLFSLGEINGLDLTKEMVHGERLRELAVSKYVPEISKLLASNSAVLLFGLRPRGTAGTGNYITQFFLTTEGFRGCTHLTNKGCKLTHDKRPEQCRELKPVKVNGQFDCHEDGNLVNRIFGAWFPYWEEIQNIVVERLKSDILATNHDFTRDISWNGLTRAISQMACKNDTQEKEISDLMILLMGHNINGFHNWFLQRALELNPLFESPWD